MSWHPIETVTTPIKFTDSEGREWLLMRRLEWSAHTEKATPADLAACGYAPRAELDRVAGLLGNLLARIHGDGGHRQIAVGDERATEEAHEKWAQLVLKTDLALAAAEKEEGI